MPAPWAPPPASPQPPPLPPHWTKDGGASAAPPAPDPSAASKSPSLPTLRRARPGPPPPRFASREGCQRPGLSTSVAPRAAPLAESPEGRGAGRGGRGRRWRCCDRGWGSVRGSRCACPALWDAQRGPGPAHTPAAARAAPGGPEDCHCHSCHFLALPACAPQPAPYTSYLGVQLAQDPLHLPGSQAASGPLQPFPPPLGPHLATATPGRLPGSPQPSASRISSAEMTDKRPRHGDPSLFIRKETHQACQKPREHTQPTCRGGPFLLRPQK